MWDKKNMETNEKKCRAKKREFDKKNEKKIKKS
jgi:hypothetical protein